MPNLNRYGAVTFDGTVGASSVSATTNIGDAPGFSIDIAFQLVSGYGTLLNRKQGSVGFALIITNDGGEARLQFLLNSTLYTFPDVVDNDWHKLHISVDLNGLIAYCYYDRVLVQEKNISAVASQSVDSPSGILHVAWDGSANKINANISEIRISNRVRATLATQAPGTVRQLVDDPFTISLFHFNEAIDGGIAYDVSESHIHLEFTGAVDYIAGPYRMCPISIIREQVWLAIDSFTDLTTYLAEKTGRKYKFRPGEQFPGQFNAGNTPALQVFPTTLPDIDPETSAFHNVIIPIQITGIMHNEDPSEIEYFWWIVLEAIWDMYLNGSTSGRFNYGALQNMVSRGPGFEVKEVEGGPFFSRFDETLAFSVHHDFLRN